MPTVHYRDAVIFIDGYLLSARFSEFGVDYGCETLDETAFGDSTRLSKGGLYTARMNGKAHAEFGVSLEDVLFNRVGVDGTLVIVFPNGITVGTQTDMGYAMFGVIDTFNMGGAVGTLLPIDIAVSSRGVDPS